MYADEWRLKLEEHVERAFVAEIVSVIVYFPQPKEGSYEKNVVSVHMSVSKIT